MSGVHGTSSRYDAGFTSGLSPRGPSRRNSRDLAFGPRASAGWAVLGLWGAYILAQSSEGGGTRTASSFCVLQALVPLAAFARYRWGGSLWQRLNTISCSILGPDEASGPEA